MRTALSALCLASLLAGTAIAEAGAPHLIKDVALDAGPGLFHAVIEIGAGGTAKMEVDKATGHIRQDTENNRPRTIRYLGYPANYGFFPQTVLRKEDGGDGDPLDVIVLGPRRTPGDIVAVRVVGVLRLLDRGERDDKIIAVDPSGAFADVRSLADLERRFVGVVPQLENWFTNYKGPGQMKAEGVAEAAEALRIVDAARRPTVNKARRRR